MKINEALEVLFQVRASHGRNYKSSIWSAWMDGNYDIQNLGEWSGKLQEIRNSFGPSWLSRVQPKQLAKAHAEMVADSLALPSELVFKVVSVSKNANAFGLYGHILMARNGYAAEVGRSRGAWMGQPWEIGMDILVPVARSGALDWASLGCEIPRSLPAAPAKVVNEVWSK